MTYRKNVLAKGNCYAEALDLLTRGGPGRVLCHGIVKQTNSSTMMGHAWVEENGWVFDGLYPDMPVAKERYYVVGHIDPKTVERFTRAEAVAYCEQTDHYGPWRGDVVNAAHR